MRKYEKVEIGCETFELVGNLHEDTFHDILVNYYDICDAYKKPSQRKKSIWYEWENFFLNNTELEMIAVKSRNVNVFTISALFSYKGNRYIAIIYPTHNDLYKVIEEEII